MTRTVMHALRCAALAAGLGCAGAASALDLVFDYRFDRGFFTDALGAPIVERRAALDLAAQAYAGLSDALAPIVPAGADTWSATFRHPSWSNFFETATVVDLAVPAGALVVFVGGSPSFSSVLGIAESGSAAARGSAGFVATVAARGQAGALADTPSDFGPWGGSIWFNSAAAWHFGAGTAGLDATRSDFLTTATHEIGHLLGIGAAPSWQALVRGAPGDYRFTGAAARGAHGDDVPLDAIAAHWAAGTTSFAGGVPQGTLMDPFTPRGARELLTELDLAGLRDVGWQLSPIPAPPGAPLLLAGIPLVAALARRTVNLRRGMHHGNSPIH
jgi:hypothetical protein